MRGHTNAFAAAVQRSHHAPCRVDVIQDGKVVATLMVHAGTVTSDGAAAQRTNFKVEVSDPTNTLTPAGMASLLTPFGTKVAIYRGVRLDDVTLLAVFNDAVHGWAVFSTGVMCGVKDDGTGVLTLGP